MIQSKQLSVPAVPILNSKVPALETLIKSHVLFTSPVNKQPVFPGNGFGFVCGFETLEKLVNSSTLPKPDGEMLKEGFEHASVLFVQSPH